jgi:hypothetical protein
MPHLAGGQRDHLDDRKLAAVRGRPLAIFSAGTWCDEILWERLLDE